MKRLTALLLSLTLLFALVPAARAAGSPPYSLQYLQNVTGSRYVSYTGLEEVHTEDYSRTQRTLEAYDALELFLAKGGSWSAIIEPFRNAFQNAGFRETTSLDSNGQNMYWFGLNEDVFIILGEKTSHDILNESGLVFIEHNHVTAAAAPTPAPTPTPVPTPAPAPAGLTAQQAAQALYELGLFGGTGTDANGNPVFDLERAPTRQEAITMLVRLLGKEAEAKAGTWNIPFSDVADWARPYVGYAYTNGLTDGTSAATYGGTDAVTASQYLTFVLRALGYEAGTDFQWDRAWELSDRIGLTCGQYHAGTAHFVRGDIAIISNNALKMVRKGTNTTLLSTLNLPAQQDNKSTNIIKANILEAFATGLEIRKAGAEQALTELQEVLSTNYSGAYLQAYYVAIMQKEQMQTQRALEYWKKAIDLCGNYSDTQAMKKYIQELVDLYTGYANYNLTIDNVLEFVANYLPGIQEQDQVINEKINTEINRWVAENT